MNFGVACTSVTGLVTRHIPENGVTLMLRTIVELFETRVRVVIAKEDSQDEEHALQLATATLLVEISRADTHIRDEERAAIVSTIEQAFDLSREETEELVELAESEADNATSLYQFTRLLNKHFSREQRRHIVELLWQVAFADFHIDKYEEYFVRKIADLLHVSHVDYIRAKRKVIDAADE